MEFRAVNNVCAVCLKDLSLPITQTQALKILTSKGFSIINVDIVTLARKCIGYSLYKRGAQPSQAPRLVDCSSFIKWLYGQAGLWLPRRTIQQIQLGGLVNYSHLMAGDVIFVSGYINYYLKKPLNGVGHVGLYTGQKNVIHAANSKNNVIETPLDKFIKPGWRGARRYFSKNKKIITLKTPSNREVETADDIKWIILQSLK
ncbi:MAG: C40 family peptidase [Patescibacteria group bacterium]